jgi:DNA-binding NarL/FixJ family response regulator
MARVLVVDDHALIRGGLAAIIRAAPGHEVVGEACDGDEAVAAAAATKPEVILMDIRMPGMSGIAATRDILGAEYDDPPRVLILTTFDLDEYVYEALRAGASGFILKDAPPDRLLTAIQAIADGDTLFAPTVTRRLIEVFCTHGNGIRDDEPDSGSVQLEALTAREKDVLRLVGAGLSNTEIAVGLVVSEGTVKTHLNRTMTKLNLSSRAQAVVVAYESGLVIPRRERRSTP